MRNKVICVLAEAYLTNPMHKVIFGGDGPEQLNRNLELFSVGFPGQFQGTKLVAIFEGQVKGFVHWAHHPAEKDSEEPPPPPPDLSDRFSENTLSRIAEWHQNWGTRELKDAHLHLGPIGVFPKCQGLGIGRRFMDRYCEALDQYGSLGYLETDRPENVAFYRKWGFKVTAEADILGIPNWFMKRPSSHTATSDP